MSVDVVDLRARQLASKLLLFAVFVCVLIDMRW